MKILHLLGSAFADGLSHGEMLTVTGLNTDRLMMWYKLKLLRSSEFTLEIGRGNRRRYDVHAARLLLQVRILADAGLKIEDALQLGYRLRHLATLRLGADGLQQTPSDLKRELENEQESRIAGISDSGFGLAAIVPRTEGSVVLEPMVNKEHVSKRFMLLPIPSVATEAQIRRDMRKAGVPYLILLDYFGSYVDFLGRLEAVHGARQRVGKS